MTEQPQDPVASEGESGGSESAGAWVVTPAEAAEPSAVAGADPSGGVPAGPADEPAPITPAPTDAEPPTQTIPEPPPAPEPPMPPPEPSTPPVTEPPLSAQPTSASSGVEYPPAARAQSLFRQRPELLVAATFVGGLLAATILKRLAR